LREEKTGGHCINPGSRNKAIAFLPRPCYRCAVQELTAILKKGSDLDATCVESAIDGLLSGEIADANKAGFLKALREKGETADEIAAFVNALLARAIDPQIDRARLGGPLLDVCGTGGDHMDLFNISTTGMFVIAAGGAVVVKHGNRGITSKCGGADVLEALGIRIDLDSDALRRCVETTGLGFLFAPNYHPAFKAIAPVRRMLAEQGTKTIFNILGPLLNPARPDYQLVGVFDKTLLSKYAAVLGLLGRKHAWALNGAGADEILPFGSTEVVESTPSGLRNIVIEPGALGIEPCAQEALRGGDRAENARILTGVLDGSIRGPKRDVVMLNAAAGFVVTGLVPDLAAGIALANEQIDSGRAQAKLRAMREFA
jgi:anthranilate phosphoribosyltransferase